MISKFTTARAQIDASETGTTQTWAPFCFEQEFKASFGAQPYDTERLGDDFEDTAASTAAWLLDTAIECEAEKERDAEEAGEPLPPISDVTVRVADAEVIVIVDRDYPWQESRYTFTTSTMAVYGAEAVSA